MNIEDLRADLRLQALELTVTKMQAFQAVVAGLSTAKFKAAMDEMRNTAAKDSIPGVDAAWSDLAIGEWEEALSRLNEMTLEHLIKMRGE